MLCLRADEAETQDKMDVAYSFACADITNPSKENMGQITQMIEKLIDAGTKTLPWGNQNDKALMITELKEMAKTQLAGQITV